MPPIATFIVLGLLVLVLIVILVRCIRIVQQSKAYIIERLGAYHTTWNVGLHFKIPFIERVAKVVSLKEQVADFQPQPVITKDNVTMQIDTVVYFQITDPMLYTYGIERPLVAIENLSATTLRNIIGDLELDQCLTSRDVINTKMRSILDEGRLHQAPQRGQPQRPRHPPARARGLRSRGRRQGDEDNHPQRDSGSRRTGRGYSGERHRRAQGRVKLKTHGG